MKNRSKCRKCGDWFLIWQFWPGRLLSHADFQVRDPHHNRMIRSYSYGFTGAHNRTVYLWTMQRHSYDYPYVTVQIRPYTGHVRPVRHQSRYFLQNHIILCFAFFIVNIHYSSCCLSHFDINNTIWNCYQLLQDLTIPSAGCQKCKENEDWIMSILRYESLTSHCHIIVVMIYLHKRY